MYVCMYVSPPASLDGMSVCLFVYVSPPASLDGMSVCIMSVCLYVCMCVFPPASLDGMSVCLYVCMIVLHTLTGSMIFGTLRAQFVLSLISKV